MKTIPVKTSVDYNIYISNHLLNTHILRNYCIQLNKHLVIITDSNLADSLGKNLQILLQQQNLKTDLISFPAGEIYKTRETKHQLFAKNYGRDTCLIALGGVVVTDMVGFLGATYCRGIPVIYIPTTLLSMVDASIGGKTGVNTSYGKNLVGTFTQPKAVLIDTNVLKTLPDKEAVKANNLIDGFKLLKFCYEYAKQYNLIGISMGEHGQCTRILGPVVGSQMSYASLSNIETAAPGQLTLMVRNQSTLIGFNTDGLGAIQVLLDKIKKPDLKNQTILILGAGGAARAIAFEATPHNAKVIILNRTLERAKQLADDLGGEAYSFDDKKYIKLLSYDILINTLRFEILPPDDLVFIKNKIMMDIVYQPIHTKFLDLGKKSGCIIIPGYEMYIHQAILQIQRWFQLNAHETEKMKIMMKQYFSLTPSFPSDQ